MFMEMFYVAEHTSDGAFIGVQTPRAYNEAPYSPTVASEGYEVTADFGTAGHDSAFHHIGRNGWGIPIGAPWNMVEPPRFAIFGFL